MDDRIILMNETSRPWYRSGVIYATGWAYRGDEMLEGLALAQHLNGLESDFVATVAELSGCFAVIAERGAEVELAVDRIRSIPLFYSSSPEKLAVSDDARRLATHLDARLDDPIAAAELMLASCTSSSSTLSRSVKQVQAGEVVRLTSAGTTAQRYFEYGVGDPLQSDEQDLRREAVILFERAFDALARSVANRQVAIPLSGGMDSRLITAMLVRAGRRDVRCFTYGRPLSPDPRISRRVAAYLGLDWRIVPYSGAAWKRWFASDSFQRFRRNAAGLATIEHEQDWPAIQHLLETGWLDADAVVVPGHAGDFLGGSHLPLRSYPFENRPVDWILQRYYTEWPLDGIAEEVMRSLRNRIVTIIGDEDDPIAAFTRFGWQERQAKMIANSVRGYEHHGLGWRLPFWADTDVLAFWGRLPASLRRGQTFYLSVLRELMGEELFDLPSTRAPIPKLVGMWRRGTDYGLGRYGIWLGALPLLTSLLFKVRDIAHVDHSVIGPVVDQLVAPVSGKPLQWVTINGLLAASQLRDLSREIG